MCQENFTEIFNKQLLKLNKFFHKKLRNAEMFDQLEANKEDLIQTTALAVLTKLLIEKYNDYHLVKLIWLKAEDCWTDFYNYNKKNKGLSEPLCENEDHYGWHVTNIVPSLEASDEINLLKGRCDSESWQMLMMKSQGFGYKEIANKFNSTEAAVKMKLSRLRLELRQH